MPKFYFLVCLFVCLESRKGREGETDRDGEGEGELNHIYSTQSIVNPMTWYIVFLSVQFFICTFNCCFSFLFVSYPYISPSAFGKGGVPSSPSTLFPLDTSCMHTQCLHPSCALLAARKYNYPYDWRIWKSYTT